MHKSTTPSLSQTIWARWASRQFLNLPIVKTLLPVTFGYSLSSEAVVMRQLRRWNKLWRRSLTRWYKRTSIGPFRSCWNGTTSALQPEEKSIQRILWISWMTSPFHHQTNIGCVLIRCRSHFDPYFYHYSIIHIRLLLNHDTTMWKNAILSKNKDQSI